MRPRPEEDTACSLFCPVKSCGISETSASNNSADALKDSEYENRACEHDSTHNNTTIAWASTYLPNNFAKQYFRCSDHISRSCTFLYRTQSGQIYLHDINKSEHFSGHVTHYIILNNSRKHFFRPVIFLVWMVTAIAATIPFKTSDKTGTNK